MSLNTNDIIRLLNDDSDSEPDDVLCSSEDDSQEDPDYEEESDYEDEFSADECDTGNGEQEELNIDDPATPERVDGGIEGVLEQGGVEVGEQEQGVAVENGDFAAVEDQGVVGGLDGQGAVGGGEPLINQNTGNVPPVRCVIRNIIRGKKGYVWSTKEPARRGRVQGNNIVTHLPGARGEAKKVQSPVEAWKLLFDDHILGEITLRTNEEISRKRRLFEEQNKPLQTYHFNTNQDEILAFIGLLYIAGMLKSGTRNSEERFSLDLGNPVFRATMPLHRFKFLSTCLRFDDRRTRTERMANDKLAPIRVIWDRFVEQSMNMYTPFEHCTVDEQLLSYRGRCSFRVYIKSKPDRYGLKIVMLNDAKTAYMVNAIPYAGKFTPPNREPKAAFLVRKLCEPIYGTNRNVTVDNWFTSVPLFQNMLVTYRLTMVGTMRKDKVEIPPSFVTMKRQGESRFAFDQNKTLVVYSPTTKKNVVLLSTMHRSKEVDQETGKPDIIMFYNATKGGTDTFDKLCHSYTTTRKTNRWPMRFFFGMLDQSGINSMVLYSLNSRNEKLVRRKYLYELGFGLVKPFMESRLQTPTLRKPLRDLLQSILKVPGAEPGERQQLARKQRCQFCPRTRDRKTKVMCASCGQAMCDDHRAAVCFECAG